jgi:hypothetical protein
MNDDNPGKPETIDLNNVTVFRISDLIGGLSPKKTGGEAATEEGNSKRKTKRIRTTTRLNPLLETSSFKMSNRIAVHGIKTAKRKVPTEGSTDILWLHNEKINYFKDLQKKVLPEKRKLLTQCNEPRQRQQLEREIRAIENKDEEIDYTLQTHDVLYRYHQMLEKEDETLMQRDTSGSITKFINKYDNVEKERITEEYCRILNNGLMIQPKQLKFNITVCEYCGGEMEQSDGFICCIICGVTSTRSVHDFKVSYHDFQDTVVKSNFSYKRQNRFQEILSTLQAKENTEIDESVLNAVKGEINKEQNPDMSSIDIAKIKYYLKRLSLNEYYEHAPSILSKINNIAPVNIPTDVEEKLREMFKEIQEPFDIVVTKVCPTRLSFLSYNFVLYKFCELLDLDEYKKHFTLLKSIDKLRLQDKIWKGICEILEWEYIPSI